MRGGLKVCWPEGEGGRVDIDECVTDKIEGKNLMQVYMMRMA